MYMYDITYNNFDVFYLKLPFAFTTGKTEV